MGAAGGKRICRPGEGRGDGGRECLAHGAGGFPGGCLDILVSSVVSLICILELVLTAGPVMPL